MGTDSPDVSGSDTCFQVTEVLEDLIRRRTAGELLEDEQVIRAHPDLMPELRQYLRALRVADEAERHAQSGVRTASHPHTPGIVGRGSPSIPAPDSFPGYDLLGEIHRGGQGVVYLATQRATGRDCAIKVLREGPFFGFRDGVRFEREVHILASLHHPSLVTIHDSGSAAGHFYYVMDYLPGVPLDAYFARNDHSIDETLGLFAKIGEAVNAAHLLGIIHRDLKPSNILIDAEGKPHVLDFGLAKISADVEHRDPTDLTVTVPGQFVGSLPWASPEQAQGRPDQIDLRTDVYSLGVLLYQMLAGRFPYPVDGTMQQVIERIVKVEPGRPSMHRRAINDEVDTIVLKCLSKDRERRYQSAGDLLRDLRRYLADEPIEAKRDSSWYVLKKTLRRYRYQAAIAATMGGAVIGFAVLMWVMYHRATRAEQAAAQQAHAADHSARCATAALGGLTELFATGRSGKVTDRELLDEWAQRVVDRRTEPLVRVMLMEQIASVCAGRDLADLHVQWRRRILDFRRHELGGSPLEIATALENLGKALLTVRHLPEAEATLREALQRRLSILGDGHSEVAMTIGLLGTVLHDDGRYDEAEALFRRAVHIGQQALLDSQPEWYAHVQRLAHFLENKGKIGYGEAIELLQDALSRARRRYRGDDPLVASLLGQLASVLRAVERYDEALIQMQESLDMTMRLNPEDHLRVARARDHYGLLLKDVGRYEEAEEAVQNALSIKLRFLGEEHRELGGSYHSLAKVYADAGDLDKAEWACQLALELHRRFWPAGHRDIARPMTDLGGILVRLGRHQEAEPLLREALYFRTKTKPSGHWELAKTKSILGAALTGRGAYVEAECWLLEGYPDILKDRGPQQRRTREAVQRIIALYEAWGKPDEAARWRSELHAVEERPLR